MSFPAHQRHGNTQLEGGLRQNELYKYFTPPTASVGKATAASRFSSPDSVLTAHVQLAAWRLNCQRSMLSLIDRETQYFVAESTKTLDLKGSGQSELEGDELWLDLGCSAVPKAGRLCDYTISQIPPAEGGPAYFEVTDLLTDPRFNQLPFVGGAPGYRYYCGVPLRTKTGVNIGSIFVLDNKPREPASVLHREILATMADNCMVHLEMLREKQGNVKAIKMDKCLAEFVDPERQIAKRRKRRARDSQSVCRASHGNTTPKAGLGNAIHGRPERKTSASSPGHGVRNRTGYHSQRSSEDSSASNSDLGRRPKRRVDDHERLNTYQRAADLLRESLSLDGGGGVVFITSSQASQLNHTEDASSTTMADPPRPSTSRHDSIDPAAVSSSSQWGVRAQRKSGIAGHTTTGPTMLIASSLSTSNSGASGSTLAAGDISRLVERHPRGKLFSFHEDSALSSGSSGEEVYEPSSNDPISRSNSAQESSVELDHLKKHFPDARQIIFIPLWDSATSRWCACFAFNTCEYRYLEKAPDFLHCIAFVNCIMSELSRIATMTADQQKSDFIGSVSHELRSPLHGILASCEFLSETECDSFQKSLVDTADACARTLLDTLNMVLDYSKINHFGRNAGPSRRTRRDTSMAATPGESSDPAPLFNMHGDVDLASITEEVVEGVASGQIFKDSLDSVETADVSRRPSVQTRGPGEAPVVGKDHVKVILDVVARDWTFVTQPGAFRRIVMNLFGNALKYTKRGFIRVKLETKDAVQASEPGRREAASTSTSVILTVTDSGCGMSPEFVRTKLFVPFSQESPLNPGTGLGLSLVRSIVDNLNGDISFQSAQNVGTEVRVTLPMLNGSPSTPSASSGPPSSGSSIERAKDRSLAIVQDMSRGKTVALFRRQVNGQMDVDKRAAHMLSSTTLHYLQDWLKFSIKDWSRGDPADIVVVAEHDLQALIEEDGRLGKGTSSTVVLVLCQIASRRAIRDTIDGIDNVEALSYPFGPYKLAKSLRICLERLDRLAPRGANEHAMTSDAEQRAGAMDEVAEAVQHVTLDSPDMPGIAVVQKGHVLAKEDSIGAQRALGSLPSPLSCDGGATSEKEYPFPDQDLRVDGTVSPRPTAAFKSKLRPHLTERRTISTTQAEMSRLEDDHTMVPLSKMGATIDRPLGSPDERGKPSRAPRLLLVDDNRINLRLLNTFVRKRDYTSVTLAEDGAEAVAAFTNMITSEPPTPPDIVFMDLTMPIMDGFQATRRIRQAEAAVQDKLPPMETPQRALIIALTGLASGRDQSEAFTSGIDLYWTKPVSMREVGRLLTNWEQHGGTATAGVPHGPVAITTGPHG